MCTFYVGRTGSPLACFFFFFSVIRGGKPPVASAELYRYKVRDVSGNPSLRALIVREVCKN